MNQAIKDPPVHCPSDDGEAALALYRGPAKPLLLVRQADVTAGMLRDARQAARIQVAMAHRAPSHELKQAMDTLQALYPVAPAES